MQNLIQLPVWSLKTMVFIIGILPSWSFHFPFMDEEERAQERDSVNSNFYSVLIELLAFCSHVAVSNGESDGEFSLITEKWRIIMDQKHLH